MKFIETYSGVYINTETIADIQYRNSELRIWQIGDEEECHQLTNENCLDKSLVPYIVEVIVDDEDGVVFYDDLMNEALNLKKERDNYEERIKISKEKGFIK